MTDTAKSVWAGSQMGFEHLIHLGRTVCRARPDQPLGQLDHGWRQARAHRRGQPLVRRRWRILRAVVGARLNVLISGGTGSGKTTMLNAMSSYIGMNERIVTIEDAAELQLQQDHVVRLETRPASAEGTGTQAEPEQAAQVESAEEPPADEIKTVSISSLTRTKYVAPKYPRAAERRGDSGWVDVVFMVAVDGSVRNVEVKDSTPEGVFDQAASRAVEKWEFEPVFEDGRTVERRVAVRMMFALE